MHVPHYKFCGPGTKLAERIERGDVGINPLDEACRQHDLAYTASNSDRRQADRDLAQYAFSCMLTEETPFDKRTVAMMNFITNHIDLRRTLVLINFCELRITNTIVKVLLNGLRVNTLITYINLFDIDFLDVIIMCGILMTCGKLI